MPPLNGAETSSAKKPIEIATCMPVQLHQVKEKLEWLNRTLGEIECDLFLTPQEFIGGHYVWQLSGKSAPLHVDRDWLVSEAGKLANKHKKHLALGACCKTGKSGATEDLLYLDDSGSLLGYHSKYALPSYDDQRTGGHGQLWPETSYPKRATPIDIPKLRLRAGTVFCWEVFSQSLWASYSYARCNVIMHPIKFAPRGWLKNRVLGDGLKHIVDFGNAPKSQVWVDRLIMASRHQCFCPVAVSCNSWNLGEKFMALVGHVDEVKRTTNLIDVPSAGSREFIHTFSMLPEYYEGLDHHHSAGAFKAHVGSVEGYSELGEFTMHAKIRRLEAQLLGGSTAMDCVMKCAVKSRQKTGRITMALGARKQQMPKRK